MNWMRSRIVTTLNCSQISNLKKLYDDIKEILMDEKIMPMDNKHNSITEESIQGDLNEAKVELSTSLLKTMVERNDVEKMAKRNWLIKIDEVENERDDEELSNYVEHDKNYFFVHLAEISCKLCSFKGKLFVQHYRTSHPESEVLISRISPDITKILIEDSIRNREEYDKDHQELEKMMCNFKCPFCLMIIKDTTNTYYNHISSHTGEYCFHCNHCLYWTNSHTNIHSHLNQMHHKIQKTEYKMVYLNPKVSKYVFGYICSECNFIQLTRTTVEEHAMVYHSGVPKIYRVNLGVLSHDNILDENCTNEIHSNKNCLNPNNSININMSAAGETNNHKIPAKTIELSNLAVQMQELEKVKVKIEPKELDSDLQAIELDKFVCETNLDIKQCSKADRIETLQWTNENERRIKTPTSNQLQISLASKMSKESKENQMENKVPKIMSEEMEKVIQEVNPSEQPERVEKFVEVMEIGPINIIKKFNVFMFHCKIQNCNYFSEDKKAFGIHCEVIHKDFFYNCGTGVCNICSIKFEYKGKFVTVYDIYLHIVTMHKHFFEPESATNFKLMDDVRNVLLPTYDNSGSEFPLITSNLTPLPSRSNINSVSLPLALIPVVTEDKKEALSSDVKYPVMTTIQSLTSKTKQSVSVNEDDLGCALVPTDIPMTDTEKQNRKCPKAVAIMMKPPLLSALYKCPKYDCSFTTTLSMSFQKHFATHSSILMNTLVPCLYCDYKVLCSSYVKHLEVRHGHCLFGCGDCFYRTTNSYFITLHREVMHPNTEFKILQLEAVTSSGISTDTIPTNLGELVPPYNCKEDGFQSCPFKTLYFEEYLTHVEVIHQLDGLGLFSSEQELHKETVMEGWLSKEVGPFQCRYCKKATVTHEEMGRHQAVFHTHEQCLFYYRKFVPNDTVMTPEQVNLEDPSFINHLIHLPNQVHLCNFKLTEDLLSSTSGKVTNVKSEVSLPVLPPAENTDTDLDQTSISLDEPETFSRVVKDEAYLLEEPDSLHLDEQPKDDSSHNDAKLQCKWDGCFQTDHSQTTLEKHIDTSHIQIKTRGEKYPCLWMNCSRKSKPFRNRCSLLIHVRVHSREKPYKCPFQSCNKTFAWLTSLNAHQMRHTGERPYLCQFPNCFRNFVNSSDMAEHHKLHYDANVTDCSKKYNDPENLRSNMKSHSVNEQLGFVLKKSSDSSDTLQCKWKDCYQTLCSQTALIKHIEKNHVQLQSGKEFTCFWSNCPRKSKPYTRRGILLSHMTVHTEKRPYKCSFQGCTRAFSQIRTLDLHQKGHKGERPYSCQFCSKSFITGYLRNYHQRLHYDCEAYACQVTDCSKKYKGSSGLRRHMKSHTAEEQLEAKRKLVEKNQKTDDFILKEFPKDLQCKWEGCYHESYDSQTALVKHINNHVQLQKGENEFTCFWINCPRKSKPYTARHSLLIHMRSHTGEKPYKCPIQGCNKAFSESGSLNVHRRKHPGEGPFVCQFPKCFKRLSTTYDRDNHQAVHYNTVYACQVTGCSEKYTDPSSLQKHLENHTVNDELEVKQELIENEPKENDFIIYHL